MQRMADLVDRAVFGCTQLAISVESVWAPWKKYVGLVIQTSFLTANFDRIVVVVVVL